MEQVGTGLDRLEQFGIESKQTFNLSTISLRIQQFRCHELFYDGEKAIAFRLSYDRSDIEKLGIVIKCIMFSHIEGALWA